jgi:hypothetical protein
MGKPRIKLAPFPAGAVVSPTAKVLARTIFGRQSEEWMNGHPPETPTRVSLNVSLWALSMP